MNFTIRPLTADVAESAIGIMLNRMHPLRDLDALAETCRYRRGQEICIEADSSEYWHRIISGAVLRCRPTHDGRRRILDILGPGDYFGFSLADHRGFSNEAASEATVMRYPRWCVEFLAEVEPATAGALRGLVKEAASRMRRHLLLLPELTTAAKVSAFLLDIDDRSPGGGFDGFDLPASTADIANYLGLSVETFERRLAILERRGVIDYAASRIRILDRIALEGTRNERAAEIVSQAEGVGMN